MTARISDKQEQVVQAIGQVARLGGYTLKKVTVGDDLEKVSLTLTFTAVSDGWHQESLDFEREDLRVHINGRGEVEKIDGLQAGDLAETGAEADAEIAAAADVDPDDPDTSNAERETLSEPIDDDPKPDIHLVGEAAAIARKRR